MIQYNAKHRPPHYDDPTEPSLTRCPVELDRSTTALVVIDPQVDFLSPQGVAWPLVGECVVKNRVVENLERLFAAAKEAGLTVAVSPHFYYPVDQQWRSGGPLEHQMNDIRMSERSGELTMESGADFMPQFKPYILDGETVICSPHKVYGPEKNDLVLQLRTRGLSRVILAGMAANLCVESHLRELIEQGFEVAVVCDATAASRLSDDDGCLATLINNRFIAHTLWTTDEVLAQVEIY